MVGWDRPGTGSDCSQTITDISAQHFRPMWLGAKTSWHKGSVYMQVITEHTAYDGCDNSIREIWCLAHGIP